jgi:hypothetical protein
MRIKALSPRRARIRKKNIHMSRRLRHLANKMLHAFNLRAVGGHGDGLGAGREVGEGVERFYCCVAGGGFAGGDVDF